jgi:3-deoxy-D-manno-octulosonate 8-phosphate phosphatase (KDO 8-P phosphatase)
MRRRGDALARAKRLRLMIFDVDGVLTDGALYMPDGGGEIKVFHVRDGHGLKMLQESGVQAAILSGRRSPAVEARAAELGIKIVEQGSSDKGAAFERLLSRLGLSASAAGYMGDDFPDLPVLERCGFAASVADAPQAVRRSAHYIARAAAGRGAAREVCEFIMQAQRTLAEAAGKGLA